jgi:hypothetical protein
VGHDNSSDSAQWAVELETTAADTPAEYFAVDRLCADEHHIRLRTTRGQELEFDRDSVRKVLLMRTTAGVKRS